MQQLPLSLQLRDNATLDNFFEGRNQALIAYLKSWLSEGVATDMAPVIYLWGKQGSGCTHLLQAACHALSAKNQLSSYLPMSEIKHLSTAVLEDLEQMPLLCIDQIQAIAKDAAWEEALFHLYNRFRDQGARLLIAGEYPLASLPIVLPDLKSRLSWGLVYQVHSLNDEEKIQALQQRAHQRGFQLSEQVGQYLLRHHSRAMPELLTALAELDRASLIAKRKLTIPFVKEVLAAAS